MSRGDSSIAAGETRLDRVVAGLDDDAIMGEEGAGVLEAVVIDGEGVEFARFLSVG